MFHIKNYRKGCESLRVAIFDSIKEPVKRLDKLLLNNFYVTKIIKFTNLNDFINYDYEQNMDVVLVRLGVLDVEGYRIVQGIHETKPDKKIIILADTEFYASYAYKYNVFGYLLTPITSDRLNNVFENLSR